MEAKYGRLFTEADVRRIVERVAEEYGEPTASQLDSILSDFLGDLPEGGSNMTFPADEPLFLLRGQDFHAADAIGDYARRCDAPARSVNANVDGKRADARHVRAAKGEADRFIVWQADHPDRVKVPD